MRKIYIVFFLFAFGCSDNKQTVNNDVTVFKQFPVEKEIRFDNLFQFNKGKAFGLFLSDSSIFISVIDGVKDHFFYQYDISQKKLLGQYLKGGRGKGQAMSAYTFGLYKKRTAWIHDIPMNKVVTVPVMGNDTANTYLQEPHDYPLIDNNISVQLMDSSRLLTHGMRNRESPFKIQLVSLITGKIISEFGRVDNAPDNVSVNTWKNAYAGFIFLKPEEDKVVLASRYSDQIEIFDLITKKSKTIKGPENFKADFAPVAGRNDIQRVEKTRISFMAGFTNSKHIYLLYSGENHQTVHKNQAKYIYVYDWNGQPVKKITLDRYVSSFTVSDNEATIYAFDLTTSYVLKSKTNFP